MLNLCTIGAFTTCVLGRTGISFVDFMAAHTFMGIPFMRHRELLEIKMSCRIIMPYKWRHHFSYTPILLIMRMKLPASLYDALSCCIKFKCAPLNYVKVLPSRSHEWKWNAISAHFEMITLTIRRLFNIEAKSIFIATM